MWLCCPKLLFSSYLTGSIVHGTGKGPLLKGSRLKLPTVGWVRVLNPPTPLPQSRYVSLHTSILVNSTFTPTSLGAPWGIKSISI